MVIDASRYVDRTVEVVTGDTVVFRNLDPFEHTVTAVDLAGTPFASELLGQGDEFTLTLDQPGTFDYYCVIHPTMRGTVVVVPDS